MRETVTDELGPGVHRTRLADGTIILSETIESVRSVALGLPPRTT